MNKTLIELLNKEDKLMEALGEALWQFADFRDVSYLNEIRLLKTELYEVKDEIYEALSYELNYRRK